MVVDKTPKKYLIELVIIFTGISGSFLVDEYREDLEINRQIKKSFVALKSELLSDEQGLKNLIALYDSTEVYYSYILDIEKLEKLDLKTKDRVWFLNSTPWGNQLNLSVFKSMEASGILYKISDDTLRNQILKLYQKVYEKYHDLVDYDLTHIQKMDDIVLKNFILTTKGSFWNINWGKNKNYSQLRDNIELKNYVSANRATKYMLSKNAKMVIDEIRKTISIIDDY
jgi:hypothetical protein